MPHFIGAVDNTGQYANRNLLLKIQEVAEDSTWWQTLRYDTSGAIHELILKGEGYSGAEEIFVGFRSYQNTSNDTYNVSVAGFVGYEALNTFVGQPGYFESGIPTHGEHIDTWLTVSPQRIAFALKVGTPVYESGYAGKFFPYDRPNIYPYPVIAAGMLNAIPETRFSDISHSMPYKGSRPNFRMRFVDGQWLQPATYPWANARLSSVGTSRLVHLANNHSLFPVILYRSSPTSDVFGELEGIYYISGFENAVENTLSIEGESYVVFQDTYRTGFVDYYALKLDT